MNNVETVSAETIVGIFGSIVAINPDYYGKMVRNLATRYDVDERELRDRVRKVLEAMPPFDD